MYQYILVFTSTYNFIQVLRASEGLGCVQDTIPARRCVGLRHMRIATTGAEAELVEQHLKRLR